MSKKKITKEELTRIFESLKAEGKTTFTRVDLQERIDPKFHINTPVITELEEKGVLVKVAKSGRTITYSLDEVAKAESIIAKKIETEGEASLDDVDEMFGDVLKTIDNLGTRVGRFKGVIEDKDAQIRRLEADKNYYKMKCEEYRVKTVVLQEKLNDLK